MRPFCPHCDEPMIQRPTVMVWDCVTCNFALADSEWRSDDGNWLKVDNRSPGRVFKAHASAQASISALKPQTTETELV